MSGISLQPNYSIPISNGILSHCKKIGSALWVFLWFIDRTTKETDGPQGDLEGMVLGGTQIRASAIAKDLDIATRTVHEHIERLCSHGYLRRIDAGEGMAAGYAVQRSKKWRKNQPSLTNDDNTTLAEISAPSPEPANPPRGFTVDPRGNPLYPRGNPLPIRRTVQDNTEQETCEALTSELDSSPETSEEVSRLVLVPREIHHTPSSRKIADPDVERIRLAHPKQVKPEFARKAIRAQHAMLVIGNVKKADGVKLPKMTSAEATAYLLEQTTCYARSPKLPADPQFILAPDKWFNSGAYTEQHSRGPESTPVTLAEKLAAQRAAQ